MKLKYTMDDDHRREVRELRERVDEKEAEREKELQDRIKRLEEKNEKLYENLDTQEGWQDQLQDIINVEKNEMQTLRDQLLNHESGVPTPKAPGPMGGMAPMIGPPIKEAEKIIIPAWPRIDGLLRWRGEVIQRVVIASGDRDHKAWKDWISAATKDRPDMESLADSAGIRYTSIDSKLAVALSQCINNAGESARDVVYKLNIMTQEKAKKDDFVLGREILAIILESFRTANHDQLMFTVSHIHELQYPGDQNLDKFWNMWTEILNNISEEDQQSDRTLRDCLWRKIKGSRLMQYDMQRYDAAREGDPDKTRKFLEEKFNITS